MIARICEARVYNGEEIVVRYEFKRLSNIKKRTKPLELVAIFDNSYNIISYTVYYLSHFGKGLFRDYEMSVYWHEQAARMGDKLAMQNLGVIYSEKGSPLRDCKKAFYWFEKAIANGVKMAMGQFAHCLLCGKNGENLKG